MNFVEGLIVGVVTGLYFSPLFKVPIKIIGRSIKAYHHKDK